MLLKRYRRQQKAVQERRSIAMTPVVVAPSPAATSPRMSRAAIWTLGALGAAVCVLSGVFVVQAAEGVWAAQRGIMQLSVVGIPLAAGLYGLHTRENERFGFALIAAAFAWSLTALGESSSSVPYSIGRVSAWLIFPSIIYLMLAFPEGQLAGRRERLLFQALTALLTCLYLGSALLVESYPQHTPWATCQLDCPPNAFLAVDHEPAAMQSVVQPLREVLAIALFAAVTASMARRWRRATPVRRRTVGPVMVAGTVSGFLLAAFFLTRRLEPEGRAVETLGMLWSLCVPGIAAAFFAGLAQRRLHVANTLSRLAATLTDPFDGAQLRDQLALALGDPTIDVFVREGAVRWRDSAGRVTAALPAVPAGREVTVVLDGDDPALAIVHGRDLRADHDLVAAAGSLVIAALRHQRLAARLAKSSAQLEESRRRIARAADVERARIERDLHDGAQRRLIMLRIHLSLAEELLQADPAAGAQAVSALGVEVDRTLDELRSLAHGVYPSVLSDRGLTEALRSLVLAAPVPVHFQTAALTRQSPEIETAVYFTCGEALQNAFKHARTATGVW